jgi:hypothetical protein
MIGAVEHSNPADYKWKFNFKRSVVILLNSFPRGRAQAPEAVRPGEAINKTTIVELLERARQKSCLW